MRVDGPEGRRYEHETGHDAEEGGSEEAEAALAADRGGGRPLPRGGWRCSRAGSSTARSPPTSLRSTSCCATSFRSRRASTPTTARCSASSTPRSATWCRSRRSRRWSAPPFIAAEDSNFYQHKGVDFLGIVRAAAGELHRRRGRARRQHDHAAGREGAAADAREELRAQGEGDPARAPPRAAAEQGRDPLPLPEPHLPRQRRVRRRRRGAGVLRQGRRRPDARGGGAARRACRKRRAATPRSGTGSARSIASATSSSGWRARASSVGRRRSRR